MLGAGLQACADDEAELVSSQYPTFSGDLPVQLVLLPCDCMHEFLDFFKSFKDKAAIAFLAALHERCGANSPARVVPSFVARDIVEYILGSKYYLCIFHLY